MTLLTSLVGQSFGFYGVDSNCFKVGRHVFEALEDESDGYRSMCSGICERTDVGILLFFKRRIATVSVEPDAEYEGFRLVDTDGHVWLRLGTDNSNGYYPSFVFRYAPKEPS